MDEKRCGTCRWWGPKIDFGHRPCLWPRDNLPAVMRQIMGGIPLPNANNGADCATWSKRDD